MRRKIEWYQEVLALEPGSRIFFPLAKLFVEFGQLEEAVATLRQGLDRHPDALEARLLLIQALTRLERLDEAREQMAAVIRPLSAYPAFWTHWAQQTAEKDRDLAVFLMLVASHFSDRPIKWTDVVIEGLSSLTDRLLGPLKASVREPQKPARQAPAAPAPDRSADIGEPDAPYVGPAPESGSYRTRTMAELLASQSDFGGAIGIYRELLERAKDQREKAVISGRIEELEGARAAAAAAPAAQAKAEEDPFGKHAKNRLMSTLEALAARLEARIQA